MEISNSSSSSSINTVEALIIETRFPDSINAPPVKSEEEEEEKAKKRRRSSRSMSSSRLRRKTDDDHHHLLLFNPSMSSSFSSTDRFDPIQNYPSISSLEIDSHQSMEVEEEEEEEEQRGGRREESTSSCSIVTGISVIKEGKRSSVTKRKEKKRMDPGLHLTPLVPKDENFELMPPPGSHKKSVAPFDVNQPIDPNEPTYCVCHQVSHGDMIACYKDNCQGGEWFHYSCVGLTRETRFKGNWYCPTCKLLPVIMKKAIALDSMSQVNGTEEGKASC